MFLQFFFIPNVPVRLWFLRRPDYKWFSCAGQTWFWSPHHHSRRLCAIRASVSPRNQGWEHTAWQRPFGCRCVRKDGQVPRICLPVIKSSLCFPTLSTLDLSACIMPSVTLYDFSLLCKLLLVMAAHFKVRLTALSITFSFTPEKVRSE